MSTTASPKNSKRKKKAAPKIEVTAPSDLEEGYEFYVDTDDNKSLLVRVPKGGVQQGDTFQARILSENDRGEHHISFGRWRDGLFDCFKHGWRHPHLCLACWCQICALGQILTRLKLDICGCQLKSDQKMVLSTFRLMCLIAAFFWISFLSTCIAVLMLRGDDGSATLNEDGSVTITEGKSEPVRLWIGIWLRNLLGIVTFLFAVVATAKARSFIRRENDIPVSCCSYEEQCRDLVEDHLPKSVSRTCDSCCSVEDLCCACVCGPCTLGQMARHTADYDRYEAKYLTDTGIGEEKEDIPEDEENQIVDKGVTTEVGTEHPFDVEDEKSVE